MLPWFGGLIVLLTVYGIVKRWETRLVLFASGFLMSIIALQPMQTFVQFQKSMTNAGLIASILSVMGFAYAMKLTKCDQHLVHLVAGAVSKARMILIPAAVMATFVINIALPSASGAGAAVGAVLIPVLMAAGVHPAVAAAAVLAGTFGSNLSPGSAHTVMVSGMAGLSVMDTIQVVTSATIVAGLVGAIVLTVIAMVKKEDRGYQMEGMAQSADFKVNFLYAMVPVLPLVLLILGTLPALKDVGFTVPASMVIGAIVAIAVTRTKPADVTKSFFDGMGKAYGDVIGIIIAAGVFAAGLSQVGLIDMLINGATGVQGAIGAAGTWGPMLIATLSGSGDAATMAFNEAVTPHAAQFGLEIAPLGTLAALAGALGRTMSPVAGVTIIVAGIAGVNPMEVAKKNMPGMIIASIIIFVMMGL